MNHELHHLIFGPAVILLMARDLDSRGFIRNLLHHRGYSVLEAANEQHAKILSHQTQGKIDLMITDATPSQIIGWRGQFARLPAILRLTDSTTEKDGGGPCDPTWAFLRKPLAAEEVTSKVRTALLSPKRRQQVLIVDDDRPLRRMTAALLEAAGYTASQAANGREALDYLSGQKPDMVLTELVMPEVEGLQLIRQLLKLDPRLKIVAMSGVSRAETYLKVATRLGARATLLKPLTAEVLLQTVRDMLFEQ